MRGCGSAATFSDGVAAVHANNSTADEPREIEAFYRLPVGRARLIEALRQKGHTL